MSWYLVHESQDINTATLHLMRDNESSMMRECGLLSIPRPASLATGAVRAATKRQGRSRGDVSSRISGWYKHISFRTIYSRDKVYKASKL